MFETVIALPSGKAPADGALRALDWQELVARLSATRELRELFARPVVQGGSFASRAAAGIPRHDEGERGVNLGSLTCSKRADATTAAAAYRADHGDRDK